MKKVLLVLSAAVITCTAMAQNKNEATSERKEWTQEKNGRDRQDWKDADHQRREEIFEKLGLNESQKAQLKTINENFRNKIEDLNKNTSIAVEDKRNLRMSLMKNRQAEIDKILSAEQKAKFDELRKEKGGERQEAREEGRERGDRGGRDGEERFNEMTKDLDLTADQQSRVNELNESFKKSLAEAHNTASSEPGANKQAMRNAILKYREQLQQILTPEQQAKFKEKMKDRRGGGQRK